MKLFRTDRALTPSWQLVKPSLRLVKENIWSILYLSFLPGLVVTAGIVLAGNPATNYNDIIEMNGRTSAGVALMLLGGLWTLIAYPALTVLMLRASRGEHPSAVECLRQALPQFFPLVFMSILGGFAVFFGLLAFVIPGLILVRGFYLSQYFLIDQKLKPVEALKTSFAASRPHAGYIWGIIAVEIIISIAGSPFGKIPVLGYFITLAIGLIYMFAPVLRYNEINKSVATPVEAL